MADISKATPDDLEDIIRLWKTMRLESPRFSDIPLNEDKLRKLTVQLIEHQCVLLARKEDQVIGMLEAVAYPHFFSDAMCISDLAVYVVPGHRGGTAAVKMIWAMEEWAKAIGVSDIVLGISTELKLEKTVNLYQRLGYKLSGYLTRKEI